MKSSVIEPRADGAYRNLEGTRVSVGLSDFLRLCGDLHMKSMTPEPGMDIDELPHKDPLTIRVLRELAEARGTAAEIGAILDVTTKLVAGTLSNMKRQNYVRVISMVPSRTCPAHLYAITAAGLRRLNQGAPE